MGFLYSWERVRSGAIPTLAAFPVLRDYVMGELRASPAIVAGSVYGSATRDDVSCRSDMDVFLVYETGERGSVAKMMRRLRERAVASHISLHVSAHSVDAARNTDRYGPSFRQTWERMRSQGLLIGEPERYYRALFPRDVRSEMAWKVRRYVRKVRRQLRQFDALDRTRGWLDRQLDQWHEASVRPAHVYINVARWMLLWRDGVLRDDSKYTVVRRFLAAREFTSMHEDLARVRDLDAGYNRLLSSARHGGTSQAEYGRQVRTLLRELLPANVDLLLEARRLTEGVLAEDIEVAA